MKVYLLEVNYYGDWSINGLYATWELAEKAGKEAVGDWDGCSYYIEPMDVITE